MHLSTSYLLDGDVVATKPWHWVHLLALAQSLAKSQLSRLVIAPREDFSELFAASPATWFLLLLLLYPLCRHPQR